MPKYDPTTSRRRRKVIRMGNSIGVLIEKHVADLYNLRPGCKVTFTPKADRLVIEVPAPSRRSRLR